MGVKEDNIVKTMDGYELAFTKLAKRYSELGLDLEEFAKISMSQVDEIELGILLMKLIESWQPESEIELYQYLAEQLKEKFIMIDKPEVIHPDDCNCGDN